MQSDKKLMKQSCGLEKSTEERIIGSLMNFDRETRKFYYCSYKPQFP